MVYNIIYSKLAIDTLDTNIAYLKSNWPKKVSGHFLEKVENTISIIKGNPNFYANWNKNIKKAIVVKQITMFYTIKENTVEILLFWNNYQNPESLIKFIK